MNLTNQSFSGSAIHEYTVVPAGPGGCYLRVRAVDHKKIGLGLVKNWSCHVQKFSLKFEDFCQQLIMETTEETATSQAKFTINRDIQLYCLSTIFSPMVMAKACLGFFNIGYF